jgi:subtilisin family serine protease
MRRTAHVPGVMLRACVVIAALAGAAPVFSASQPITLITGDRVTLGSSGPAAVQVAPRKGRESIRFASEIQAQTAEREPQIYVIPEDAVPLISAGSLDRELFNVTALQQSRRQGSVPLVVTYTAQTRSLVAAGASLAGASVTRQLESINGIALSASDQQTGRLWDTLTAGRTATTRASTPLTLNGSIRKIWLDKPMQLLLDRSVPQIGAPTAWNLGYQGEGVVVAVIDSGVDLSHPDLAGKVLAQQNFTTEADTDLVGHGTHVASTIAGSGAASGGKYRGVAPGAMLVSAKACFVNGCPISSLIDGMEWAVMEQGAKIVNMSLGGADTPDIDPLEQAVNQLTSEYGALFVIAAGNSGRAGAVSSPSTADAALSVAAVDRVDQTAFFSSRGPRSDGAIKPEIAAPGAGIVAALASGVTIGTPVDARYTALDGTSMATPHVAGAAALLSQRHPEWGPHQLKAVLIGTAKRSSVASAYEQGAGRVDVEASFALALRAEPSTLGLPKALWPHGDDEPVTRTVTYTNDGATSLTLTLRADGRGPNGMSLPAGMVTVSPSTLTIAPGATATAQVTVDTRGDTPDAIYSGALIADANGRTFTVPFAVERESESYDVRVSHIGANGLPTPSYTTTFLSADAFLIYRAPAGPGEVTIRLPVGRYAMDSSIFGTPAALFHQSLLVVNGPTHLILDVRNATPIEVQDPVANALGTWTDFSRVQRLSWGVSTANLFSFEKLALATQTLGEPSEDYSSTLHVQWLGEGSGSERPVYSGAWVARGKLISDPTLSMPLKRSSTVRTTYGNAVSTATSGISGTTPTIPESFGSFTPLSSLTLPVERKEIFYSSDDTVRWSALLEVDLPQGNVARFQSGPMRLLPGRYSATRWNEPPFSPALPGDEPSQSWAYRSGNALILSIPLFGDRSGHAGFIGDTKLELFANGQKIGEGLQQPPIFMGAFGVPPERATYRLQASSSQSSIGLSSNVTAAWTFTSELDSTASFTQLPFLSLRLDPRLNAQGQAYRGAPYAIPISARRLGNAGSAELKALSVEASFDDGHTWHRTFVKRQGQQWIAVLTHPKNANYVSLRAVATDFQGNALEQQIVRAYGLTDAPKQ